MTWCVCTGSFWSWSEVVTLNDKRQIISLDGDMAGISHGQAQKSQEKNLAKTTSFPFVEAEMFTNIKFSFFPECKLVVHLLGQYSSF